MYSQLPHIALLLAAEVSLATASPIKSTNAVPVSPVTSSASYSYESFFTALSNSELTSLTSTSFLEKNANFPINFGHGPVIPSDGVFPLVEITPTKIITIQTSPATPTIPFTLNINADELLTTSSHTLTPRSWYADNNRKLNWFGRILLRIGKWAKKKWIRLTSFVDYKFDADSQMVDIGKMSKEEFDVFVENGGTKGNATIHARTVVNITKSVLNATATPSVPEKKGWKKVGSDVAWFFDRIFNAESYSAPPAKTPTPTEEFGVLHPRNFARRHSLESKSEEPSPHTIKDKIAGALAWPKIAAGFRNAGYWFKGLFVQEVTHEREWREQRRVGNITKQQFELLMRHQRLLDHYGPPQNIDNEPGHNLAWVDWAVKYKKVPFKPIERSGSRSEIVNPNYIAWDIVNATADGTRPPKYERDGTPTLAYQVWAKQAATELGTLGSRLQDGSINPVWVDDKARRHRFRKVPSARDGGWHMAPIYIAWAKQEAQKAGRPCRWLSDGMPNPVYWTWDAAIRKAEPWKFKWKDDWEGRVTGEYSHEYLNWAIKNMKFYYEPPRLLAFDRLNPDYIAWERQGFKIWPRTLDTLTETPMLPTKTVPSSTRYTPLATSSTLGYDKSSANPLKKVAVAFGNPLKKEFDFVGASSRNGAKRVFDAAVVHKASRRSEDLAEREAKDIFFPMADPENQLKKDFQA